MKDKITPIYSKAKEYIKGFSFWLILSIVTGGICGLLGSGFSKCISLGVSLREEHGWMLYLLPVAGIVSVLIYKLCRVSDVGTNHILQSIRGDKKVPILLAPAIFAGTVLSHTFGASVGREGAALQLGGSVSSLISKVLKLTDKTKHILTMCAMAAVFSALFGTPLGAAIFSIEVASIGQFASAAIFPCLIASVSAYFVAGSLGITPERFEISDNITLSADNLWKVAVIAIAGAFVSILFCTALHKTEKLAKKVFKNEFLRIIVGGIIIVGLTLLIGTTDYNGGGVHIIERVFSHGEVRFEAFLLKIIFTAICVAAGFKGGEIVPTLFIGATMGGSIAILLGLSPSLGAAVGIAALLCGVTNCPLGTLLLCIELFGSEGMIYFALSMVISFILSGKASLYTKQHFVYSKLKDETA